MISPNQGPFSEQLPGSVGNAAAADSQLLVAASGLSSRLADLASQPDDKQSGRGLIDAPRADNALSRERHDGAIDSKNPAPSVVVDFQVNDSAFDRGRNNHWLAQVRFSDEHRGQTISTEAARRFKVGGAWSFPELARLRDGRYLADKAEKLVARELLPAEKLREESYRRLADRKHPDWEAFVEEDRLRSAALDKVRAKFATPAARRMLAEIDLAVTLANDGDVLSIKTLYDAWAFARIHELCCLPAGSPSAQLYESELRSLISDNLFTADCRAVDWNDGKAARLSVTLRARAAPERLMRAREERVLNYMHAHRNRRHAIDNARSRDEIADAEDRLVAAAAQFTGPGGMKVLMQLDKLCEAPVIRTPQPRRPADARDRYGSNLR